MASQVFQSRAAHALGLGQCLASGWLTDLILSDCQSTTLIMLERLEAPSLRPLHLLTRLSAQKASLHGRY